MSVSLTLTELGILIAAAAAAGGFTGQLFHHHAASRDTICPVCFGPTDDAGTWHTRKEETPYNE